MAGKRRSHGSFDALWRRAERVELGLRAAGRKPSTAGSEEAADLLHELRVHQVELELQNEELREAQLALTEARDRLEDLYEFAPVGYLTLDGQGKIVSANLTAVTMFGTDRRSFIGKSVSDFIENESQSALHLHIRAVAASHLKQSVDLSVKHSSELPLYFRVDSIAEKARDGYKGCRCTLTDVTEIHLVQQELKKLNETLESQVTVRTNELQTANVNLLEEARKRDISARELALEKDFSDALIRTAQTIILVLDRQGRIVSFNRYLEELSGYTLEEMRGKMWVDSFIPERDRGWLKDLLNRSISGSRVRGNINAIVTRSGEERYIEWYDTELTTPDGKFTGLLCTGQDVTERRMLYQQLLDIAQHEQQRIGQQLHDDLGQELVALRLSMDMILDGLREENSTEVQRAVRVTNGLIEALRKVRDLSHGLITHVIGAGDFTEEVRALCDRYQEVSCRCECDPAFVVNDDQTANQLYYILREALANAITHGGVEDLRVEVQISMANGRLVLSVHDNGVGISEQSSGGSGMQIMQYRAELIGAFLDVRTALEGGTIVTCTLPFEESITR